MNERHTLGTYLTDFEEPAHIMKNRAWDTDSRKLHAVCGFVRIRPGHAWLVLLLSLGLACGPSRDPETPAAGDPVRQSVAEYDIARDLFVARGNARAALDHALKAVELDDDNADAAHLVSLIYLFFCATSEVECRLEEAEKHVRRAIKVKKDYREAKNTLGVVLIHQKRYEDAIAVLDPLANDILYSTPETAWGNLGWAYLLKGDLHKAIESLRRALALQPEFCVGAYRLALAYEKKGDHKDALDALSRALDTDRPECRSLQDAFRARARIAMRLGDHDSARSDLERCRELDAETQSGRECAAALAKFK